MDGRHYLLPIIQVFDDKKTKAKVGWEYQFMPRVTVGPRDHVSRDHDKVISTMRQRKNAGFAQLGRKLQRAIML